MGDFLCHESKNRFNNRTDASDKFRDLILRRFLCFLVVTEITNVTQALNLSPCGDIVDARFLKRFIEIGNRRRFVRDRYSVICSDTLKMPFQDNASHGTCGSQVDSEQLTRYRKLFVLDIGLNMSLDVGEHGSEATLEGIEYLQLVGDSHRRCRMNIPEGLPIGISTERSASACHVVLNYIGVLTRSFTLGVDTIIANEFVQAIYAK